MSRSSPAQRSPSLRYGVLDRLNGYAIRRAQMVVFDDFAASMEGTGATPALFSALTLITENAGLSQSQLASAMGIGRSAVVPVLDTLEEMGLVLRLEVEGDARRHGLHPTLAGRRKQAAWSRRVLAHDAKLTLMLTEAEQATLRDLLRRVGA
jgi:DNA-binding MarR family transcriptional regulator